MFADIPTKLKPNRMKQFIVTVPNPYKGEGSRGVASRIAPQGEPSVTTLMAYAESEASARQLVRVEFATRYVPDGTEVMYVTDEPRIKREILLNISDTFKDEFSRVIIKQLSNAEKAVELLGSAFAFINDEGNVMSLVRKGVYTMLESNVVDELALQYDTLTCELDEFEKSVDDLDVILGVA